MASIKPKIAPTGVNVNDALQDLTVVHAINLERLKASETAIVMDILDDSGLVGSKATGKDRPNGGRPNVSGAAAGPVGKDNQSHHGSALQKNQIAIGFLPSRDSEGGGEGHG